MFYPMCLFCSDGNDTCRNSLQILNKMIPLALSTKAYIQLDREQKQRKGISAKIKHLPEEKP